MAVPRPLLLALLGTVLLAVTFMVMRNSKSTVENATAPAGPAGKAEQPGKAPAPAPKAASSGGLSAQDAIRAVLAPGKPVRSGRFDFRLEAKQLNGNRRADQAILSGRFDRNSTANGIASFSVDAVAVENGRRERDRVVASGGQGYVTEGGSFHKLSPATLRATARVRRVLSGSGSAAGKLQGLDPASWMKGLKAVPGGKVDGVDATHVSGRIAAKRVTRDIKRVVRSAGSGPQAPRLPRGFYRTVERALVSARVDAWVGTQDRIARRVRLAVTGSLPRSARPRGSARWRTVTTLSLTGVNEPQKIAAPTKLGKQLEGRKAREARDSFAVASVASDPPGGVLQISLGMARLARTAAAARVPRAVARAVKANRRVVIFFSQRRGVDDPITARAVAGLRRSEVAIFNDSVNNVAAYGEIVQSVGVTRAPSVVIIGRDEKARLIEGYVDPQTLAQEVADTR